MVRKMNELENMLSGEMEMEKFLSLFEKSSSIRTDVNNLIPLEAKLYSDHIFWGKIKSRRENFIPYDFDVHKFIEENLIKYTYSRLGKYINVYGFLHMLYAVSNPEFHFTTKYYEQYEIYLDVVKDIYDGPEVSMLVDDIINSALRITGKKERIKVAKESIMKTFHVENKKHPRWLQGAEWPMGSKSPMKFSYQKSKEEHVEFVFQDVDTAEIRVINQYY